MKTLVVYYSYSGKTEIVARTIAEELGADIRKIEEVKPRGNVAAVYLFGGQDAYKDKCSEIKPIGIDIDSYDLIFIGTPDWASKPAPAVNAFISETDFNGKNIVLFCTAGGRMGIDALFTNFTRKIAAKSGKVVGTFAIQSSRLSGEELAEKAKLELNRLPAPVTDGVTSKAFSLA